MRKRIAYALAVATIVAVTAAPVASAQDSGATTAQGPRTIKDLVTRIFVRKPTHPPAAEPASPPPAATASRPAAPRRTVRRAVARAEPPALPRPRIAPFSEVAAKAAAEMPAALALVDRFNRGGDRAARRVDGAFSALETIAGPLERVGSDGALLAYGATPSGTASEWRAATPTPDAVRPPRGDVEALIDSHARANGIPVDLARGLVFVLSTYNPQATGAAGEIGLMQISLTTARGMGYEGSAADLYDPAVNLTWGMKYLAKAQALGDGSACQTLLRYSAGHYAKTLTDGARKFCAKVRTAMVARR